MTKESIDMNLCHIECNVDEYIKESRILYELAKAHGGYALANELLNQLFDKEDCPYDVSGYIKKCTND